MKKLILAITLTSIFGFANAQEMVSKKGVPILPEAKDWSIGFDAKPIFNYFGNMFNNSVNDSLYSGFQEPLTLVGKYFKDANTAYRASLRIGYSVLTDNAFIDDENSQVTPRAKVTDTRTTNETNILLGLGKQKYRGKGRLKGYYGAEAALMVASRSQTFSYGNQLNSTNSDPALNSTNFGAILGDSANGNNIQNLTRIKVANVGSTFGLGVRGFIGIEYFFAAKFSIGAEYGWSISGLWQGKGELTAETFDGTNVVSETISTGKHSLFNIDNDNAGGAIFLSAYF